MRTVSVKILFLMLLLFPYGCISLDDKDCGSDKQCLQEAFKICDKAHGTWKGRGGDISIKILEKQDQNCKVELAILEQNLEITNQSMICFFPPNNENFSIN